MGIRPDIVTIAIVSLLAASGVQAATHYINAAGTGNYPTIQDAVNASVSGDSIVLAAGTYTGAGNRDIDFGGRNLVVTSDSGPEVTVLDCGGLGRGFYFNNFEDATSVIDGITITNGSADFGAGVYVFSGWPSITNSIFANNVATGHGGGVYYWHKTPLIGARPVVSGNTFSGNQAGDRGGGMYLLTSNPIVENNVFSQNTAVNGGAVYALKSDFNDNIVVDNMATERGGGIYFGASGPVSADSNIVTGNHADIAGGGIAAANTDAVITNTFVYDNTADLLGGGVYCWLGGTPAFETCTISGNGGGTTSGNVVIASGVDATFEKCIISFATTGAGMLCFGSNTTTFTCCDVYGNPGGDSICGTDGGNNISADPLLCNIVDEDYQLLELSPCTAANSPCGEHIGAGDIGCVPVGIIKTPTLARLSAYPNPFSSSTTITLSTDTAGRIDVAIYDVRGRLVRRLRSQFMQAGSLATPWDGRARDGDPVPSGIYFVRVVMKERSTNAKLIVLR